VQRVAVDDVRALKELKGKGVAFQSWDDGELGRIRALAQRTWEEWSKKTPLAKKAYDAQTAWLRDLGALA
jgi:TRAP-type mannitol/chloroaromatic compound transport system substrate-binding protein